MMYGIYLQARYVISRSSINYNMVYWSMRVRTSGAETDARHRLVHAYGFYHDWLECIWRHCNMCDGAESSVIREGLLPQLKLVTLATPPPWSAASGSDYDHSCIKVLAPACVKLGILAQLANRSEDVRYWPNYRIRHYGLNFRGAVKTQDSQALVPNLA